MPMMPNSVLPLWRLWLRNLQQRRLDDSVSRSFDGIGVLVVTDKSGKGVEDVFTFVPKRGLKKRGLPPEQTPEGTH